MYEYAIETAKENLFFRPMTKGNQDILISGKVNIPLPKSIELDPEGQHLSCYIGGMMGLGAKIFDRPDDLVVGQKLLNGCLWAYRSTPSGLMPEVFRTIPCEDPTDCDWDESTWHRAIASRHPEISALDFRGDAAAATISGLRIYPGFAEISDRRYILRSEAIESLFVLYRITGNKELREAAWSMFQSIFQHTFTSYGNAAISDVTVMPPPQTDNMESFWTAETLKYFYLIFSEPDLVDLDRWVFNTEGHPFKRPV